MEADPFHVAIAVILILTLIAAIAFKAHACEDCTLAMLPLAGCWLALEWRLHPDFRETILLLTELVTFGLLVRLALRFDRRFPLLMAAFALIAVMSGVLAMSGLGLEDWQHRLIANWAWSGATLALIGGLARHVPHYRSAPNGKRLR